MSPRGRAILALLCLLAPSVAAQDVGSDDVDSTVEAYMTERGLRSVVAAQLRRRLDEAPQPERVPLAERLGRIYVELLEAAPDAGERRRVEALAHDLLGRVPEAQTYELRINLAKANYLAAEQIAEKQRLRLAEPDDLSEADRLLRLVTPQFREIASKTHRRVETLEKRELRGTDDERELAAELDNARRVRSLAMYYAGWSNYYLALLSGETARARESLQSFGWLLNARDGREASVDQVPTQMLRYEHVAKAAVGAALCESLLGQDVRAKRWLDEIESAPDVSAAVCERLFTWRMIVACKAKRWADLSVLVEQREPDADRFRLSLAEARLLAVLTLEALDAPDSWSGREGLAGALAQVALGELVKRGEIEHVLDLVDRYGTAPIGTDGFVVRYVRALLAYQRARDAQGDAGDDPDRPSTSGSVVVGFREAARAFEAAVVGEDADRFPEQRARAGILLGLSLYSAGDLVEASDRLTAAAEHASGDQREEALWYAVVAAGEAVDAGHDDMRDEHDQLATLYLQSYPASERAAKLLLRRATSGLVSPRQAVEVLLAVPPGSPVREVARRQAANLLYTLFTDSAGSERQWAAGRFLSVADEVVALDRGLLQAGDAEAGGRLVGRARQVLDAALSTETPDVARAHEAMKLIDEVAGFTGNDAGELEGELAYRRLQIALATGDRDERTRADDDLRRIGGRFADAADRLLFRRALGRWEADESDTAAARELVAHGSRVLDGLGAPGDATARSLADTIARAAASVWEHERDVPLRDRAIELDRALIEGGHATASSLRRLARLLDARGEPEASLDAWRRLMNGAEEGSGDWYEARVESLRLLARTDPVRARTVLDQHKLLVGGYGPEPWGGRLREIDKELGGAP